MILSVDSIGPDGLDKSETIPLDVVAGWLGEAGESEWHPTADANFTAHFDRLGAKVLMKAEAAIPLEAPCARCLKPAAEVIRLDFLTCFVSGAAQPHNGLSACSTADEPKGGKFQDEEGTEASFDLESPDEEPFDGRTLNTDSVVCQELLVNLPLRCLCSPDCKGLCPSCGQNLNEKSCSCEQTATDPRWDALKSIRIRRKD